MQYVQSVMCDYSKIRFFKTILFLTISSKNRFYNLKNPDFYDFYFLYTFMNRKYNSKK